MNVNLDNYVELAINTEAPITPEMKERFQNNMFTILRVVNTFIDLGSDLDDMKKYLFYNKGTVEGDSVIAQPDIANRMVDDKNIRLFHSIIGIITEASELMFALKKNVIHGEPHDDINFHEEYSDIFWYCALGLSATNGNFQQCLQRNIEKLASRYPDKFTEFHAINRNIETERVILEGKNCSNCESVAMCNP